MRAVRGRLAPSPTGAQHVGNARTFLLAWLAARAAHGRIIFRMEDIDSPRVKPRAARQALDDLRWLGLDWDEGPDIGGPHAPYTQSERRALYQSVLAGLCAAEVVYPCTCSRADVESAASAPHAGQDAPVYPGTCAQRRASDAQALGYRAFCWRFRTTDRPCTFSDRMCGPQSCRIAPELGDFVIARRDGAPAYQLAVVVDDHAMQVTDVVRGEDLLPSTFRQLALYDFFGWAPPEFAHVPLVVGADGRRLAKRHGDTRLSTLRAAGLSSRKLTGFLAHSCGLVESPEPVAAADLVDRFAWSRVSRRPLTFSAAEAARLLTG